MNREYEIQELMEAKYRAAQVSLEAVNREEERVRSHIAELETRGKKLGKANGLEMVASKTYGGDVLWHAWVDRQRSKLRLELVRVLARKADHQARVIRAHGKREAARTLVDKKVLETKLKKERYWKTDLCLFDRPQHDK